MRICHVMLADKYVNEYIEFMNKNFKSSIVDNVFVVFKNDAIKSLNIEILKKNNIIQLTNNYKNLIKLKKILKEYDKIFCHGLFNKKVVLLLLLSSSNYYKKVNWIIWGGDLYHYKYRKHTIKANIYEIIRKYIIRNITEITALVKGDYKIARKVYKTNAKYNYAFYPNPINFKFLDKALLKYSKKDYLVIQIGNSADPTNEHIEILNMLSEYKDKNIKIVCPLSYGNKEYAGKVIKYGNEIFHNKFKPVMNYISPEEYSKILANIDIAIFNHRRQQALGNIIGLLYLRKKVYIRSDITSWEYFKNLGITLYDLRKLNNSKFEDFMNFNTDIGQSNRKIIANEFSEEHCVKLWKEVLI